MWTSCYAHTATGKPIPIANQAPYLGLHLDSNLKRTLLDAQFRKFTWLTGYRSSLNLVNKRLIFLPMWAYGCEIQGIIRKYNQLVIERFPNKFIRAITIRHHGT